MTSCAAPIGNDHATVDSYEELRTHVLDATTVSRPAGLIVLLRQGVAAWMLRRSASSSATTLAAPTTTYRIHDETHAAAVRIVASMVLAPEQEMSR